MKRLIKVFMTFLVIGLCISLTNIKSYAQSFLGSTSQTTTQPANPAPTQAPAAGALTPEEFNKIANQVNQQNSAALSKEVQQSLPKLNPTPPPQTTKPGAPVIGQPQQSTPPAVTAPTVVDNNAMPAAPGSTSPAPTSQVYTGFGAPAPTDNKASGTSTTGTQQNSGGWRIHY